MITKLYIRAEQALIHFKQDQRGVTAIEYAVLGVAVAVAVTAAFKGGKGQVGPLEEAIQAGITKIKTTLAGS